MPPRQTPVDYDPFGDGPSFDEAFAATNRGGPPGSSKGNPVRVRTNLEGQQLPRGTWVVDPRTGKTYQVGAQFGALPGDRHDPNDPNRYGNRVPPTGVRGVSRSDMLRTMHPETGRPNYRANGDPFAPKRKVPEDMVVGLGTGVSRAVSAAPGMLGDAQSIVGNAWENMTAEGLHRAGLISQQQYEAIRSGGPQDYTNVGGAPTSGDTQEGWQTMFGAFDDAQTLPGKYAQSIGEQAPAALTGRGWTRLADPVLSGLGSQAFGDAATASGHPEWEGLGRMAGGFGGSWASNLVPNGRELAMLGRSLEGIDPAQQQAIQQLMQDAHGRGIQLTLAEAADQVTGGQSAGRLQRFVESTPEGANRFGPVMAQRPAQVTGAVNQTLDDVFPPAPPPGLVAQRGQQAAEGTLATARQRVNESARPLYDQLPGQQVDPGYQAFLENDPSYIAARDAIRNDPVYAARYGNIPDGDMEFQNVVVQRMRTDAENAMPTEMREGDRFRAGLIGESADNARAIGDVTSPEYTLARQTVETGHRAFVDPLVAGPLGRMAGDKVNPQLGQQTAALFPADPFPGADAETVQALQLMALRDPNIGADLTRAHLGQTFASASQDLQPGLNAWGGAKWRAQIAGNPLQRQTLEGALAETGGEDINSLLEVLAATGKRQHPGSMTAFNVADQEAMRGTNALSGMLSRPNPWQWLGEKVEGANASRNATALSDALLSSPDEAINVMNRAQGVAHDNPLLRAVLASYLSQQNGP